MIDASVALAWCFPDEASDYADRTLLALEGRDMMVPALWAIEVANAMLVAERRKRIKPAEIRRFVALLGGLAVVVDAAQVAENVNNVLPLAREYGLSAYDAAYLDVALRHEASLASLDVRLQHAGRRAGIEIFSP